MRKVIAFHSYCYGLIEIVIASYSYCSGLLRIGIAAYSYCSKVVKALKLHTDLTLITTAMYACWRGIWRGDPRVR
jgi:hypothetical protein